MGRGGCQGLSAAWPGALEMSRREQPGHFGRGDKFVLLGGKTLGWIGRWERGMSGSERQPQDGGVKPPLHTEFK
jgi:hypothetical protein